MKHSHKPVMNAMLTCDKVITEAGTGKKSLIGIFESINAGSFPCVHSALSVYIKLTNALGQYRFHMNLSDLENDTVIGSGEIPDEVVIRDPLDIHELIFDLRGLKFAHPGRYEFQLFANNEIIGQKAFMVNEIKGPAQKEGK
jgi:hypothetical protein